MHELIDFILINLPNTEWYKKALPHLEGDIDREYLSTLEEEELFQYAKLIESQLGLYFSSIATPSEQMSNKAAE